MNRVYPWCWVVARAQQFGIGLSKPRDRCGFHPVPPLVIKTNRSTGWKEPTVGEYNKQEGFMGSSEDHSLVNLGS